MNRAVLPVLVLALGVSGCSPPRWPMAVGTDAYFIGRLQAGRKFGVGVGEGAPSARAALLARKLDYAGRFACTTEIARAAGCDRASTYDQYFVDSLTRHGLVWLQLRNERVYGIIWVTQPIPEPAGGA